MKKIIKITILLLIYYPVCGQGANLQNSSDPMQFHLVFNQSKYAAGDTVFFKGYLFNRHHQVFYHGKKIVNFKLIDDNRRIILHKRFVSEEGQVVGQLFLPADLQPSVYSVAVYVNDIVNSNGVSVSQFDLVVAGEKEFVIVKPESDGHEPMDLPALSTVSTSPVNPPISIRFDKEQYASREMVEAKIEMHDVPANFLKGDLTVSVTRSALFPTLSAHRSPHNRAISEPKKGGIMEKKNVEANYPYFFKGKVVLSDSSKLLPDSTLITFYLNTNDFIYGVYPAQSGEFYFPLFKNFEDDEVLYIIQQRGRVLKNARIVMMETPAHFNAPVTARLGDKTDDYFHFTKNKRLIFKSYNFYSNPGVGDFVAQEHESMEADFEIVLDKFERFNTMGELITNILQTVRYRKNSHRESVRVFLKDQALFAPSDPYYIIDGVMTDSTGYLLSLDPQKISKIKVLRTARKLSRFGAFGKNGIVVVEMKIPDPTRVPHSTRTLSVKGVSLPIHFPEFARDGNKRIPDVRSTLYWNPDLKLDHQGIGTITFFTGNITGPIKIHVEGISDKGEVIVFEKELEILFRP